MFLLFANANNSTMRIGVLHREEPRAIIMSAIIGDYDIIADNTTIASLNNIQQLQIVSENGKLNVKLNKKKLGIYTKIYLKRKKWGASIKLKPTTPNKSAHEYSDNITITPYSNKLRIINTVYIEHYISGVIEAEAGSKQNLEYYKVQAIICRTYALANKRRHSAQGFQLCDKVHCQVYHNKSRSNPNIITATHETKGTVLVDSDINLITAGFHSNCGGQTINSEHAWKYPVSYLKAVCDTFCSDMPHANWEAKIPKNDWLFYLQKKYNYPIEDSLYISCALDHWPEGRELHLNYLDSTVLLTKIRKDWKLRSTQFYLKEENDTIYIQGKGFGHGIGLCQEGAMKMANLGHRYNDILHYYYTDVHLVNLSIIDFFRD